MIYNFTILIFMTDVVLLSEEIISGRRLSKNDDLSFFYDCDLGLLCKGANKIKNALCGDDIELCSIVNAKSGRCGENCKFCAQSIFNHSGAQEYGFIGKSKIYERAKSDYLQGVNRFSLVTSGKALTGKEFEEALETYKAINKDIKIGLCASMGFLSLSQLKSLKEAGVTRYHHNIETSENNFNNICTSHSYKMKIETIRLAKEAGLEVCSGGIIGMGETLKDRIDMALELSLLDVASIPLNVLNPIPGTPFEKLKPLTEEEILRTIAIFRYINPKKQIRLAAGRARFSDRGKKAFLSGANSCITGNMLTTTGTTIQNDKKLINELLNNEVV